MVVLAAEPKANGTHSQAEQTPPTPPDSLWPNGVKIGVIGLTGEFASGKTIFGVSISPGPSTRVYDMEDSSGTYAALGFDRVDVSGEMVRRFPKGYKPIDLFQWWLESVRAIPAGKFKVIMLDPVSEVESGLVEYVKTHPEQFGFTASQFAKSSGLMWGAVKDYWKAILADVAARCETFVFTSHLRNVWKGGAPTGKREAKGKETLMELASLYLHMDRRADSKGNVPDVPAANVLKNRLAQHAFVDGELKWIDLLPPRLPRATPAAIREYIKTPPDYAKLKPAERVIEDKETEGEIEAMKLARAEAERDAEALRNDRMNRAAAIAAGGGSRPTATVEVVREQTAPAVSAARPTSLAEQITDSQITQLVNLKKELEIDSETWTNKILRKRNVTTARDLSTTQAAELIDILTKKNMNKAHREVFESLPKN